MSMFGMMTFREFQHACRSCTSIGLRLDYLRIIRNFQGIVLHLKNLPEDDGHLQIYRDWKVCAAMYHLLLSPSL